MSRENADIQALVSHERLFRPLANKTVLVTGGTGFIGSMLLKTLHAADRRYALALKLVSQIRDREKAHVLFGGLYPDIVFTEESRIACDCIIHTVSPTASSFFVEHPVETVRASVESTMTVLETARINNAAMVYLSSMEVYGVPAQPGQIMTEDRIGWIDHLSARSSYSASKRLCECLCAAYASEYGVDVKIARLAQTVGAGVPSTDNRMPIQFARAAAQGQDIVLHTQGKSVSNFVYLSDAISGILTILHRGAAGQAYNVCNDKETRTVREIAELLADKVSGGRIGVRVEIPEGDMGYAPDNTMLLNSDKLRSLGWDAEVGLAEAYRRLAEYLK